MPSAGIKLNRQAFLPVPSASQSCGRARLHAFLCVDSREKAMKAKYTVTLAMLAGFGLGAVAVQGLHAQAKPPVYQITEIDVLNQEAYLRDYAPKAQAAIRAAGGKFLAAGGKTTTIEGEPPKVRVVIQQWDSVEQIQAYRNSAAWKELLPLRDRLAKFRSFTVEGAP
jgi:uncharacterized protein (DUF1330 family)